MLDCLGKPRDLVAHVPERLGQVDRHIGSTEKAERLLGWRARTSFAEGLERTVSWYRDNEAWWRAISEKPHENRLLVLGAGPAQLGLLRAAQAARALHDRGRPRPAAPGFRFASRRAIVSTEDELGVERLADAERVDGIVSPGSDWPVAVAARVAEKLALPHPISPQAAILATSKLRQRERLRRGRRAAARATRSAARPRRRAKAARRRSAIPCVVKAPDRQGQKGLTLVRSAASSRTRSRRRSRPPAPGSASSRSSSTGPR